MSWRTSSSVPGAYRYTAPSASASSSPFSAARITYVLPLPGGPHRATGVRDRSASRTASTSRSRSRVSANPGGTARTGARRSRLAGVARRASCSISAPCCEPRRRFTLLLSPVTIRLPTTSPATLTLLSPTAPDAPGATSIPSLLLNRGAVACHDHASGDAAADGDAALTHGHDAGSEGVLDDRREFLDQSGLLVEELLQLQLERPSGTGVVGRLSDVARSLEGRRLGLHVRPELRPEPLGVVHQVGPYGLASFLGRRIPSLQPPSQPTRPYPLQHQN